MAIYKCSWEAEPGTTRIKFNEWSERVLNLGSPDLKTSALTTGPHCLLPPFKDQASADIVRTQLNDLSQKIHKTIQPVFVSQKINQHLKLREAKPPLVNQQSLVYQFKCDLCNAGYVGFTRRHLHEGPNGVVAFTVIG